jgi:uncharacterized membrane protein
VAWWVRGVVGFDVAAFTLLLIQWAHILHSDPALTRARAASDDPGRLFAWLLASAGSFVGLFSSLVILRRAAGPNGGWWTTLGLISIVLAWVLTHTEYTLRYAHLYYRHGHQNGLEFPGGQSPSDLDFAYFSFTIGMCFQVSDVTVSSPLIRRTVLAHALTAFIFNTTIVALTLNLVSGLLGR